MQGAATAGRPFGAPAAPATPSRGFSLQSLVLGAAVVLLLFLVGYPLLWLIFAAFGMRAIGSAGLRKPR